jgi:hypothetical protein
MGGKHAYLVIKDLGSLANKLWTRNAENAG